MIRLQTFVSWLPAVSLARTCSIRIIIVLSPLAYLYLLLGKIEDTRHCSLNMTSSPSRSYSVLEETSKLLQEGILKNPLTNQHLVPGVEKYAERIHFEGSHSPQLPVNWRFAESLGALKALEATYVNAILDKVYGLPPQEVVINT